MTTALLLFASTFVAVFALVLQSLNVNGGHRVLACITSLFISGSNLVLFKTLPGDTDWLQIAAYLLGGPVAVLAGMVMHPHLVKLHGRLQRKAAPPPAAAEIERTQPEQESVLVDLHAVAFARRLLDPEDLGHLADPEIRQAARRAVYGPEVLVRKERP